MVIVLSMTGKFWVNVYCIVLSGHGSLRSEAPLYTHRMMITAKTYILMLTLHGWGAIVPFYRGEN